METIILNNKNNKETIKTINILALARRNLNYLNQKQWGLVKSTMKTIIFNNKNNENYKHPMARAPRNLNYLN